MKSQLSLDPRGPHHFIRSVSEAGIRVDDTVFERALAIAPDAIVDDWPPQRLETLAEEHFETLFALDPEVVLLGTGAEQAFLHPSRLAPFYRRGIGVEVMTTPAACRTFNVLVSEERRVVAALLPLRC
jgi:uncharacterized protein